MRWYNHKILSKVTARGTNTREVPDPKRNILDDFFRLDYGYESSISMGLSTKKRDKGEQDWNALRRFPIDDGQ